MHSGCQAHATLLALGPLRANEIVLALKAMYEDTPSQTAFWRARDIALAGAQIAPIAPSFILHFLGRAYFRLPFGHQLLSNCELPFAEFFLAFGGPVQ